LRTTSQLLLKEIILNDGAIVNNDVELVAKLNSTVKRIKAEINKIIIGQEQIIDQLLISLFSRVH
jgi:hypothetical protein